MTDIVDEKNVGLSHDLKLKEGSEASTDGDGAEPYNKLKRQLKNRHIAMIRYVFCSGSLYDYSHSDTV